MVSYSPVKPIPASAGIGLRDPHIAQILEKTPPIPWLEVHSENYFGGGILFSQLESIAEHYPLSFHGVGLSLGSADPVDAVHLAKLKELVEHFKPGLVSEHISWSKSGSLVANDLLPIPYTEESLQALCDNIKRTQDTLGRQILVENPSSYISYKHSSIPEWEFLRLASERAQCGILLDVNNIYVSSCNHGFDAHHYIKSVDPGMVGEIHLAGHSIEQIEGQPLRIDTHSAHVCEEVWQLYALAVNHIGQVPTLIEWDADIPELDVLLEEADKAQAILDHVEIGQAAAVAG